MMAVCDLLEAASATKVEVDTSTGNTTVLTACFIRSFRSYREFKGAAFPVPTAAAAASALAAWLQDTDELVPRPARAATYDFVEDVGWSKDAATDELTLRWIKLRASSRLGTRAFLPATQLRDFCTHAVAEQTPRASLPRARARAA